MGKIIITKKITSEYAPRISPEKCMYLELPNGDFEYETTNEIEVYWNSQNESQQEKMYGKSVRDNIDLEQIIEERMNNK